MTTRLSRAHLDGRRIVLGIEVTLDERGLSNLRALAATEGRELADWVTWHMTDVGIDAETMADDLESWATLGRIGLAVEIVNRVFHEASPWYNNLPANKYPVSRAQYLAQVKQWAQPAVGDNDGCGEISQSDADQMHACAVAALSGDGAAARRIALAVWKNWGDSDYLVPENEGGDT